MPSPGAKLRLNTEQAIEGATNLRPQPFTGTYYALLAFFWVMYSNFLSLGNIQGAPDFEFVKMNIIDLLKSRERLDLIPVWEKFLSQFPTDSIDENVPCDDIYGELLRINEEIAMRYILEYYSLHYYCVILYYFFLPIDPKLKLQKKKCLIQRVKSLGHPSMRLSSLWYSGVDQ